MVLTKNPLIKIVLDLIVTNNIDKSTKSHNNYYDNNYGTHLLNKVIYENYNTYLYYYLL